MVRQVMLGGQMFGQTDHLIYGSLVAGWCLLYLCLRCFVLELFSYDLIGLNLLVIVVPFKVLDS